MCHRNKLELATDALDWFSSAYLVELGGGVGLLCFRIPQFMNLLKGQNYLIKWAKDIYI